MSDQPGTPTQPQFGIYLRGANGPIVIPLPENEAGGRPSRSELLTEQTFASREEAEEYLTATRVEHVSEPLQRYVDTQRFPTAPQR